MEFYLYTFSSTTAHFYIVLRIEENQEKIL